MAIIESTVKPNITESLGNGYWYYNYNIVPTQVEGEFGKETRYTFNQIRVMGKPEYKKCVELVLRDYISSSQEFDLINSANKDLMMGITESDNITKYKEYLNKVEQIKNKVSKDLR